MELFPSRPRHAASQILRSLPPSSVSEGEHLLRHLRDAVAPSKHCLIMALREENTATAWQRACACAAFAWNTQLLERPALQTYPVKAHRNRPRIPNSPTWNSMERDAKRVAREPATAVRELAKGLFERLDTNNTRDVVSFLRTNDVVRLMSCSRAMKRTVPDLVDRVDLCGHSMCKGSVTGMLPLHSLRPFRAVRRLDVSCMPSGEAGDGLDYETFLPNLTYCLTLFSNLEELRITDDDILEMVDVLRSFLPPSIRVLRLGTDEPTQASLCKSEPPPGSKVVQLFASRRWPCLTHLELSGNWLSEDTVASVVSVLSERWGTLRQLEGLTLAPTGVSPDTSTRVCEALGVALRASGGQNRLRALRLAGSLQFPGRGVAALAEACTPAHCPELAELHLAGDCRLDDAALCHLSHALRRCTSLRSLSVGLAGVRERSVGAEALAAALGGEEHLRGLESLNVQHGRSLHEVTMRALLQSAGGAALKTLDLRGNRLGRGLSGDLAAALERCGPWLEELDLSHNMLDDSSILLLATTVAERCPRLRRLRLGDNLLGDVGAVGALAALQRLQHLEELDLLSLSVLGGTGLTPAGVVLLGKQLLAGRGALGLKVLLPQDSVSVAHGCLYMDAAGMVRQACSMERVLQCLDHVEGTRLLGAAALVVRGEGRCHGCGPGVGAAARGGDSGSSGGHCTGACGGRADHVQAVFYA